MTIKEAILKTLQDSDEALNPKEILEKIKKEGYYNFGGKTPPNTISSLAGDFIRDGDIRVKREKINGLFFYYTDEIKLEKRFPYEEDTQENKEDTSEKNSYVERGLHKLFSTYLYQEKIHSKTIFHESSSKGKGRDKHQIWTHPDMVGVEFLELKSDTAEGFMNSLDKKDTFKIFSYELKRDIKTDKKLKEVYFQAVSNSSWANYGYLVSFEISNRVMGEMQRLNEAFGIGVIHLKSDPFRSKVLFEARYKDLDFKMIDKLCEANPNFSEFIKYLNNILTAGNDHKEASREKLIKICDDYFKDSENDEIRKYCEKNGIPIEEE